jgi:hypothetical protein
MGDTPYRLSVYSGSLFIGWYSIIYPTASLLPVAAFHSHPVIYFTHNRKRKAEKRNSKRRSGSPESGRR